MRKNTIYKKIPSWLIDELPYFHYDIKVGQRQMHVMEKGSGKPIVLVHGNPMWGYLYKKVLNQIEDQDARLIVPDLVGFGFSEKIKLKEHSLESHTEWMADFFRTIKEDSIGLVIHDWGGMIGVAGAIRAGKKIDGIVVMNTSVTAPKEGFTPTWFHALSHIPIISDILFRLFNFPQAFLKKFESIPGSYSDKDIKSYKYPFKKIKNNAGPLALARMVPNSMAHPSIPIEQEVEEFLKSYKGPAEIVWGMNDSVMWKLRRRTARLFSQADTIKTDAGHFVQHETPEKVVKSIIKIFKLSNQKFK